MIKSYKDSGVDKEEGYKAVELMKKNVLKTHNKSVLTNLGSFGAMYELGQYKNPVLISGTDGVGTKLEIAMKQKKYDTVGIDCVAMCVNDVLCHGAKPLFFLDYLACGKLDAEIAAQLVSGVTEGCLQSYAALIGGETAEMPGFYKEGDYDIAGFCVGIVEKENLIDGSKVKEGNKIIAVASSGFHSNGYSLVRKVFTDYNEKISLKEYGENVTMGDVLLTPTKIYVKPMLALFDKVRVKSVAHITGGGFYENIPRSLPDGVGVKINREDIKVLPIFRLLASKGNIPERDMFNTYNMGVGMTCIVAKEDVDIALEVLRKAGEDAYVLGEVVNSKEGVVIC